jgi:epoxyqueuosine reductase
MTGEKDTGCGSLTTNNPPSHQLKAFIRTAALRTGFQKVGFATPEALQQEAGDLSAWLAEGRHGTMDWMARRRAEWADPQAYFPPVRTVVSLAMNYYRPPPGRPPGAPKWSNYAWGDDYHRLLMKRLKGLLAEVAAAFPGVKGLACVDTSPVMEKVWARRAGLGWQGKHTNLITRECGSWVFLGELLLDTALEPDPPFEEDLCGTCSACLDACPTGALTAPYRIDAARCISYLTIEHRGAFSRDQMGRLQGWIYGCDVCQAVCPWNVRFARPSPEAAFAPREFITTFDWEDWAAPSRERWDKLLRGSAARRAGYEGLRRNILAQARSASSVT